MVELGAGILEAVVEPVPPLKTEATAAGRRPRRARTAAAIQRVFQACGAVFAAPGTVHAPAEVALLRAMLSTDEARRQFNEVNKLVLRSMRAKSLIGLIRIRVTVALHYRSERLLVCLSG